METAPQVCCVNAVRLLETAIRVYHPAPSSARDKGRKELYNGSLLFLLTLFHALRPNRALRPKAPPSVTGTRLNQLLRMCVETDRSVFHPNSGEEISELLLTSSSQAGLRVYWYSSSIFPNPPAVPLPQTPALYSLQLCFLGEITVYLGIWVNSSTRY